MKNSKNIFILILIVSFSYHNAIPQTITPVRSSLPTGQAEKMRAEIQIKSTVFENEGMIPTKYTCDGEDISPPLSWSNIPKRTKSIAIINDDPDAPMGTWVHWVIYNLPADLTELPENVPTEESLKNGARQGTNDFKRIGYGGPCPPGGTHRYFFKIYALDKMLDIEAGATKEQLLKVVGNHIIGEGTLMGRYSRNK